MANFSCPTSRHTNFHWRFGIPNCAAANVTISNRGGIQGLEVQLAAAPRTEADAAALRLVVECGLWDSYWGVKGFPFDPGLPTRLQTATGNVPKFVSWPGQRSQQSKRWSSLSRLLSVSPIATPRRVVHHAGVALFMYRHTWVGHFGHNLLHNLACIIETFDEWRMLHLLPKRTATYVALDLGAHGSEELPMKMLSMLFHRVLSASQLPTDEEHVFEHALLGQAHRHMLHMSVYATPSLAQRRLYRSMGALLELSFCRGARAICTAPASVDPKQKMPGLSWLIAAGRGVERCARTNHSTNISADPSLPPVRALVAVRCSAADVTAKRCRNEDPNGSKGRRALLNEDEVIAALITVSAGTCVFTANPGTLPLAQQVMLFRSMEVLVAASGSALIGMFFMRPRAVVVELLSFQGTSVPDTTWHELGISLGLTYKVLHEQHWFARTALPWDRREAIHVEPSELVDLVRSSLHTAYGDPSEVAPALMASNRRRVRS